MFLDIYKKTSICSLLFKMLKFILALKEINGSLMSKVLELFKTLKNKS